MTPSTNYLLYVYNPGDAGFEGTFDLMVEHPGMDDAGITGVNAPVGLVCTSLMEPKVILTNFGETTLTSVTITYASGWCNRTLLLRMERHLALPGQRGGIATELHRTLRQPHLQCGHQPAQWRA
ncbi:MAG: hypothetical protein IPG10_06655 [Flavobacteriales bacterium]|nr:hypothetical protein [Flavobacteriales bacterium]